LQLCALLLLASWFAPGVALAQFQNPTPDELKMTSDPQAPGAAAVYLYREEKTDDPHSFVTIYERVKVLTEKGKSLATVSIPYEKGMAKISRIEGRTIHADGTVIPLTAKPDDLVSVKEKGFQEDTIVFTLPSVDVGSILEYRLTIRYDDNWLIPPTWDIQQAYYVHKAHYEFDPDMVGAGEKGRLMWGTTPAGLNIPVVTSPNKLTLDVADIPATPDDDSMPPLNTIRERVEFYYTSEINGAEYWKNQCIFWSKGMEGFANPSAGLKSAAAGMIAPGDTDEQKARKIYDVVTKLENTMFTREKSKQEQKKEKLKEIRKAEDVWKDQSGTPNQVALLYVALARAAGLKAWPMWLAPRDERIFSPLHFSIDQLSDFIVVLEIDGKTIYLDPGQKVCGFGQLAWQHTLTGGMQMNEGGAKLAVTPADTYKNNLTVRAAELTVDPQGGVTGTVHIEIGGAEAVELRQVAIEDGPDELKKKTIEAVLDDVPDGMQIDLDHFDHVDDYESRLVAEFKVSGSLGAPAGKYFILPGLFFETRAKHPFVAQAKRTTPIDVHFPRLDKDMVTYHLPDGYTVEGTPKTDDVNWPGSAMLKIDSGMQNNVLNVTRLFARNYTLLNADTYPALHDFYLKLAQADQQQIVLTRTAAPKGN
jgi:hypothetical protein